MDNDFEKLLSSKRFDTEHALNLIATNSATIPAVAIYDDELLQSLGGTFEQYHIYMVGLTPNIRFEGASQEGRILTTEHTLKGQTYRVKTELPEGARLGTESDGSLLVRTEEGQAIWPSGQILALELRRLSKEMNFKVLYIGQAYGDDGSRSAIDRLRKHETLQKISIKGIPIDYTLSVTLVEVASETRVITMFNPFSKERDATGKRISSGLDKLFGTSEAERTALYEAAFIRYFQPEYNKIFKDSFPSTNLKTLRNCYDKDFASLVCEYCFDYHPYNLFSDQIISKDCHMATYDLHKDADRHVFFSDRVPG